MRFAPDTLDIAPKQLTMASWDGSEVARFEPKLAAEHPDWVGLDCGCCGGIEWSAVAEPVECRDCNARGIRWVHVPTGTVAEWPGGYLLGGKAGDHEMVEARRTLAKP